MVSRLVPPMLTEYEAAELLLQINAVSVRPTNPFRYESGLLSPIYVDCRVIPSHPKERALVADSLTEALGRLGAGVDIVVGMGTTAITLAESVARRLGLPMAYVRRSQKAHGKGKQIEGASVEEKRVFLISDIIATGEDIPSSIKAIVESRGLISRVQAVFDMQVSKDDVFPGGEHTIPYGSLTNLRELLSVAEIKKRWSRSEIDVVREWHESPTEWDSRRRKQLDDASRRDRRAVAEVLLRRKAVTIRTDPPFSYAAGGKGPIYTDCRILLAFPQEREFILNTMVDAVVQEIGIENIDCIAAVATAGIPYASGLSDRLSLPMVIVKSKADEHGLGQRIEGALKSGMRVLLLEDLVNEGASIISAALALQEAGAVVITCMSLFTYGLSATREKFALAQLGLLSLCDLESLLLIGVENGDITREQQEVVREWATDPRAWTRAG